MKRNIHSYIIGNEVCVDITHGVITRTYVSRRLNYYVTEAVFLGETSMKLLICLLERSGQGVVTYSDILYEVWDARGLMSSYKRLGQVMKILREKLLQVGIGGGFILTVRGKGYRLSNANITKLYSQITDSLD